MVAEGNWRSNGRVGRGLGRPAPWLRVGMDQVIGRKKGVVGRFLGVPFEG